MKKKIVATSEVLLFLLISVQVDALCLKDCNKSTTESTSLSSNHFQNSNNRDGSHNFGDVKNSIIGDVNIRNGHERLEITGMEAKQSMIDASINSTVILGDMQQ